jgi:hypothetical protein
VNRPLSAAAHEDTTPVFRLPGGLDSCPAVRLGPTRTNRPGPSVPASPSDSSRRHHGEYGEFKFKVMCSKVLSLSGLGDSVLQDGPCEGDSDQREKCTSHLKQAKVLRKFGRNVKIIKPLPDPEQPAVPAASQAETLNLPVTWTPGAADRSCWKQLELGRGENENSLPWQNQCHGGDSDSQSLSGTREWRRSNLKQM